MLGPNQMRDATDKNGHALAISITINTKKRQSLHEVLSLVRNAFNARYGDKLRLNGNHYFDFEHFVLGYLGQQRQFIEWNIDRWEHQGTVSSVAKNNIKTMEMQSSNVLSIKKPLTGQASYV